MELRRAEKEGVDHLANIWKTTPGAELEAMLTGLDLTGWQDIIQYLRSLGMRENQQIIRMNVCLSNDIRFTLEGTGVVQAFCRDNKIHNKPYTAMVKENITDAVPIELESYPVRAKLKREVPLAADDMRVKDALSRWDQLSKLYRQIQRFEFIAPNGIALRFDVSIVREGRGRTYQESQVGLSVAKYEAEVELTADREITESAAASALLLKGLGWLLQGRQRSYVLVSTTTVKDIHTALRETFRLGGGAGGRRNNRGGGPGATGGGSAAAAITEPFRYPAPQPATLERKNMTKPQEPGVPNLITTPGGYNVTDKADGLRCMLHVARNGKIYLIDGGGRVYGTGLQLPSASTLAGTVLDGEWIQRNRSGEPISYYYAFDILSRAGGDTSVAALPFMIAGETLGSTTPTRHLAIMETITALQEAKQTMRGIPATAALQIGMKTFRTITDSDQDFFRTAVSATLDYTRSAPYNTDGLIFTPNMEGLPLGQRSWPAQLKWKPSAENTIDFLVVVERERDARGKPTAVDAIGTKYREDAGHTVRFKTLRLFVGSSRDGAYSDPRATVLSGAPLPTSTEEGAWRPVEFRPTAPRDSMAAICYMAIGEGIADPAGGSAAATALDTASTTIRASRTGDVIQSDMIVEMAYHPERAPGWRWEPIRVRHDKTERWRSGTQSGTMNADWVANSIWSSLHNPITETAIRTGVIAECVSGPGAEPVLTGGGSTGRRAPARDLLKVQCMLNFHDDGIKRAMLYKPTLRPGASLCDLAMGRATDIHKWIASGVSNVFGCDVVAANLNDPDDGAYRRLLDKMVSMGGRDRVPPMTFVQADAARRLKTGEAGITAEDQTLLAQEFGTGGRGVAGFDVASCMFALPYMFRDENTLAGFLTNLADTVKVGGYFIGCCFDGDAVAQKLFGHNTVIGRDGGAEAWAITKRYGSAIGSTVPPSAVGLGLAIDVDFISVGETRTEYLVSWPFLQAMLATAGLEPLTVEECVELGLPASSQMFRSTWTEQGERWAMSEAMKEYSFMNRWFVFKRRSDARPAPPREPVAAPAPATLTQRVATGVAPTVPTEVAAAPVVAEEEAPAIIPLPDEEEEAAAIAESKDYLVSLKLAGTDNRLGPELMDWPRYLATGMLFEIEDRTDPSIKYPSIDAAVSSEKYKLTEKPELGPRMFRVEGAIHQKYERQRKELEDKAASKEELDGVLLDELRFTRAAATTSKMTSMKVTWDQSKWDSVKGEVYRSYIRQRYERDGRYRAMIDAIHAKGGQILIENGTEPNQLGVGVLSDGTVVGGENMIGKLMMANANL